MRLLAVETATDACSAALYIDAAVQERWQLAPRAHTRLLLPMVEALLAEAGLLPQQLDAVAFGRGPGSFTGVRLATAVAQGIALGADLPALPVSTLAALAQDHFDQGQMPPTVFIAMDARMGEVFWGVYRRDDHGFAGLLGEEAVVPPTAVDALGQTGMGFGSGWLSYGRPLGDRLGGRLTAVSVRPVWPRASAVARLAAHLWAKGLAVPVEQALPVYLRDKVANTEQERAALAASLKTAP